MNPTLKPDLSNLPKYLLKKPEIRARTLKVYQKSDVLFQVPGNSQIYNVHLIDNVVQCTCEAARHGAKCAHAVATQTFLKTKGINITALNCAL
jgi:hypothetical protein